MIGWADLFQTETTRGKTVIVGSASPAILTCILLFILPQSYDFWPFSPWSRNMSNSPSLITWRLIETKMCWGVIFLLGRVEHGCEFVYQKTATKSSLHLFKAYSPLPLPYFHYFLPPAVFPLFVEWF